MEHFGQLIRNFFRDVRRNLLHIGIALQVGTGYVEGNVRRVNNPVQQSQELRHNFLYAVGNEDLVAVQVDFIALHLHVFFDFRKVQDPCKMERIVYVQMDVKQRRIKGAWVQFSVKTLIVLFGQGRRSNRPSGFNVVDLVRNLNCNTFHIAFVVFFSLRRVDVFRFCTKEYRDGQKLTIFG